ncbi:MAG: hypothetical protein R3D29_15760 [Nitratireductor sp.]
MEKKRLEEEARREAEEAAESAPAKADGHGYRRLVTPVFLRG